MPTVYALTSRFSIRGALPGALRDKLLRKLRSVTGPSGPDY